MFTDERPRETRTIGAEAPATEFQARALEPSASFWFAMLAASALGTNLGDFSAELLSMGLAQSFGTLAVISFLAIWADVEFGRRTEFAFWIAIVALRAAATNVGDFLTHDLGLSYVFATVALGALTLFAGRFTLKASVTGTSPLIDWRYWGAMLIGGVFGTIGGDLTSHSVGLFPAAAVLTLVMLAVIRVRASLGAASMVGYWCIVLAERAAGTPIGDALASQHGLALGLPAAMIVTVSALLVGLWLRQIRGGATRTTRAGIPGLGLAARWALIVYSLMGSGVMLAILFREHPRSPWLVLYYIVGLALNALFLLGPEWTRLRSFRLPNLISLWFAATYADYVKWSDRRETELRRRLGQGQAAE